MKICYIIIIDGVVESCCREEVDVRNELWRIRGYYDLSKFEIGSVVPNDLAEPVLTETVQVYEKVPTQYGGNALQPTEETIEITVAFVNFVEVTNQQMMDNLVEAIASSAGN